MKKWGFGLILLLLLVGFWVRASRLGEQAVWWDEAWSAYVANKPFLETTTWTARDAHPPLYQWALHGWVRLAGLSEFSIRYLSVLLGGVTLALTYAFAKRYRSPFGFNALALALISLSLIHINWSQETRMYALASLFVTLAFVAYSRLSLNHWGAWGVLVIACAGAPLSHYLGAFAPFALGVHWLLTLKDHPRIFHIRFITAMVLSAVLLGGWVLYALTLATRNPAQVGVELEYNVRLWLTVLHNGQSADIHIHERLIYGLALMGIGGILFTIRQNWRMALLMAIVLVLPPFFLGGVGAVLTLPITDRYFSMYAPVAYVAFAWGLWAWWRVFKPIVLGYAFVFLLMAWTSFVQDWSLRYYQDDYASMVQSVALLADSGENIAFISGERYPLIHYYFNRFSPLDERVIGVPVNIPPDEIMPFVMGNRGRSWVVYIERVLGDRDGQKQAWIDARYTPVFYNPVSYNGFGLYALKEAPLPDYPKSDLILPPVIREARPLDWVRIGVPAQEVVTLYYGENSVFRAQPEQWELVQTRLFGAYPNGEYVFEVRGNRYPFQLTHAQSALGTPSQGVNVSFEAMELLGYDSPSIVRAGETVPITLYWQANTRPSEDKLVYLHLRGAWNPETNSPLWSQKDGEIAETPLTAWWEGLQARDVRLLTLPNALPSGTYALYVGMYDPHTGTRTLNSAGNDDLFLGEITVR